MYIESARKKQRGEMGDSARDPEANSREERERLVKEDEEDGNVKKTQKRICDFCGECLAVLYCRADSAKLCFSCDRQVHSTNQLFTKHTRSQLCDSCDSAPASFLCFTENSVLCQNCDWERHGRSLSSSMLHDRRPLEGFTGCPCVTELLTIVGFEDLGKKVLEIGGGGGGGEDGFKLGTGVYGALDGSDEFADLLVWDTPSFVSLDDLIVSTHSEHNFQAIGVPPPPKNRNAATGQYKREILDQLRELAKLEPDSIDGHGDTEPLMEFQALVPEEELHPGSLYADFGDDVKPDAISPYEWCSKNSELSNKGFNSILSYSEENYLVPEKDSEIGGCASHVSGGHEEGINHYVVTETSKVLPKVSALDSQERGSAISRYKEKKKTRRYDKHIRYESRKVRAETRTRIKGRFAKMDH